MYFRWEVLIWSACASNYSSKMSSKACTQVLPLSLPTFLSAPLLQTLPDAEAGGSPERRVMTMGLNQGGDREWGGASTCQGGVKRFIGRVINLHKVLPANVRVWRCLSFSGWYTMGQCILLWFIWLLFDLRDLFAEQMFTWLLMLAWQTTLERFGRSLCSVVPLWLRPD